MQKLVVGILVFGLVAGLACPVNGAEKKPGQGKAGLKGGLISSGDLTARWQGSAQEYEFTTEDSYTVGFFADFGISRKTLLGFSIDIYNLKKRDYNELLLEGSINVKGNFRTPDGRMAFRPGAGVGYAGLKNLEVGFLRLDKTSYLTLHIFGEMVLYTDAGTGLLGEVGWLWALDGGNSDVTVTGGPMLIMRFGLVF